MDEPPKKRLLYVFYSHGFCASFTQHVAILLISLALSTLRAVAKTSPQTAVCLVTLQSENYLGLNLNLSICELK